MRVLIVFCHPDPDSYVGSIQRQLAAALAGRGHAVQVIDLYAEEFDPVLGLEAWRAHRHGRPAEAGPQAHIAALRACEALVLVYPTWWYGLPAMLKGWFDRVWQPGVAFSLEDGVFRTHYMPHVRRAAVITTHGSPGWFIARVVGDPARRALIRGLGLQFARGVRIEWQGVYDVDARGEADLARARDRAVGRVARFIDRG
jgi:putative NADPH-quinone reductase